MAGLVIIRGWGCSGLVVGGLIITGLVVIRARGCSGLVVGGLTVGGLIVSGLAGGGLVVAGLIVTRLVVIRDWGCYRLVVARLAVSAVLSGERRRSTAARAPFIFSIVRRIDSPEHQLGALKLLIRIQSASNGGQSYPEFARQVNRRVSSGHFFLFELEI